jgi:hypothetical protein
MKQQSVTAAETELARAIQKCEILKDARNFDEIATHWVEFLVAANRIYTKLEQGAKDGSSKGWFDTKKNLRRADPLLSYLQHARNADEHGIEQVQTRHPVSMALDTDEGRLEIPMTPGTHTISFSGSPPKMAWLPPSVRVVPVIDRGKSYASPSSHLGQRIDDTGLLDIASLAVQYLKTLVAEAQGRVVQFKS